MTAASLTTIKQWLEASNHKLKQKDIQSHSLDSLVLLEHVLRTNRASLLAHQEKELSDNQQKELNELLIRRLSREPLAYIIGKKEFYGRNFKVDETVLIPRPESESFIELLKRHKLNAGSLIDIGCGSGILGITAKLEAPNLQVTLSDVSKEALKVAEKNAKLLRANVHFKKQNLFNSYYDIALANLPYVPSKMKVEKDLEYEPSIALFVDGDGLDIYRDFCKKVAIYKPRYVLTESLLKQHTPLEKLMHGAGYHLADTDSLVQLFTRS